jgi:hypothetical protein
MANNARDLLGCCLVLLVWVLALYGLYGVALLARRARRRFRVRRRLRQSWPLPGAGRLR